MKLICLQFLNWVKYKEDFKDKDVGLGFMSFFTKAVVCALKEYPDVHSMIDGDHQIKFDFMISILYWTQV